MSDWGERDAAQRLGCGANGPRHAPGLDTHSIFREMIARELRCGRLTSLNRSRIVRFAAQMGLTAVEAGRLIAECREEAARSDDPIIRAHALRLIQPSEPRISMGLKIAIVILIALCFDALIVYLYSR